MPMHAIGLIIASYKPWYLGLYRSMCMHIVIRQDVLLWQSVELGPGVGQVEALKPQSEGTAWRILTNRAGYKSGIHANAV
jgi:hypothetical protein